jgi:amidohydrolase
LFKGKIMSKNPYLVEALSNLDEIRQHRRDFHKHPELGFQEFRTAAKIAEYLEVLGLEVQTGVAGTGVVGLLRGREGGKTAALRADIDALPMQEKNDVPYASSVPGVMHACGHDGHTAMLMETARLLVQVAENLRGNVKFIFQPCEDMIPSGAEPMIREGVLQDPDVDGIFTIHLVPTYPQGTIWVKPEYISISSAGFKLILMGKGGHVGTPHQVVDPITMAGMLITSSQSLMSKRTAPGETAIFGFGTIEGGTADNIIPEQVSLSGSIRTATPEEREKAIQDFERIVQGIASAAGGDYQLDIEYANPSIYNDPALVGLLKSSGAAVLGADNVNEYTTIMAGGDDAAYFQQKVPGVYWLLGTRSEEQRFDKPLHSPFFDFDECVLALGAAVNAQAVTDFLRS